MISVEFFPEDLEEIKYCSFNHPHPRVQQKMWTLWLKAHKIPHAKICELVGITENTLRAYLRSFKEGGVEALKKLPFYRPTSELDEHRETLEAYFTENPPSSAAHAIEEIYRITGIKRGLTQTRAFMHRLGLDFRKVGAVPSKADPQEQEEFKKKAGANTRRGETWSEEGLLCRRSPFRDGFLPWLALVFQTHLCSDLVRAQSFQRLGGIMCLYSRTHNNMQHGLYQCGKCVRSVDQNTAEFG